MPGFLGMRSTLDWPEGDRPKSYREMILRLYPNGAAALTSILSFAKKERVDDYQFHWWTKALPEQRGDVTGVFTDSLLSQAYTSGGTAGDVIYVQTSADAASEFRAGHQVLITSTQDLSLGVVGKCIQSVQNGDNSFLAIQLKEDDDNSLIGNTLANADTVKVSGNINPQGGVTPPSISYNPTKFFNYTQIFRTPLEITRTARRTRFRTGDKYIEMKREALELHSIEMEWALMTGVATETIGDNGHPETTTEGIITNIRNHVPDNFQSFKHDSNYSGATWLDAGEDWLLDQFEKVTRYNDQGMGDYIILAGSGALKALHRLARNGGDLVLESGKSIGYGIEVTKWVTSFGVFPIRTAPLFSYEPAMRNAMLIVKPKNIYIRYIDDTMFYGSNNKNYGYTSSGKRIDGLNEEFLTELGFEYHFPQTAMFLYDLGEDNVAT